MKIYISQTKRTGQGVFADKFIRKGEIIFVFRGKIITFEKYDAKYNEHPRALGIGNLKWIDPYIE